MSGKNHQPQQMADKKSLVDPDKINPLAAESLLIKDTKTRKELRWEKSLVDPDKIYPLVTEILTKELWLEKKVWRLTQN